MFWLAALSVLGVVALGPQVVLGSFKFKLSDVVQCEPVNITFSGNGANNHSVPTTLTILPIADNGAPIYIPIPNGATNTTGITLSFIPLPAGTRFLASLDNVQGPHPVVSDVTGILNSTSESAKSDCFASDFNIASVFAYQFNDTLGQCEPFTVVHAGSPAPKVTMFSPQGGALPVLANNASDPSLPAGSSSYIMNGFRGFEVLLLMDNGVSQQTTKLVTIDGDSNSPKSCFPVNANASNSNTGKGSKKQSAGLSRGAVLGIAIGASVVVVLTLFVLLYILRARRRARTAPSMSFDPALLNQKWPPDLEERKIDPFRTPPVTARSPFPPPQLRSPFSQQQPDTGFVRDPIYTNEKYSGSIMSDARSSISSWNSNPGHRGSVSSSRLSMNTLDAQDILQMANVYRDRSSNGGATISHGRATPQPSTAGTNVTTFDVAKPSVARLVSTRRTRHTSDPPDLPVAVSRNNSAAISGGYGPTAYGVGLPAFAPSSYATFGGDGEEGRLAGRPDGVDGIGGFPIPAVQRDRRDTSDSWGNVVVQ